MTGDARYLEADRAQLCWDLVDLDGQLAADHRARVVWAFVEGLDLSRLYDRIRAREGEPGRPPPDPKILLALWLFATLEGVGSARQLDRLCTRDVAYRWLCGSVPMNYHGLSDFRCGHGEVLDQLLTQSLTALLAEGLVKPQEIAMDGTKVRASAGRGSFRRRSTLSQLKGLAEERVRRLKAEVENDAAASEKRRQAARQRGAEERARRVEAALKAAEKLSAEKAEREKTHKKAEEKKGEVRASTTDPEARLMRFADGAVRPGYNVQLAVDPSSGIILGTDVTDRRNDAGQAGPMAEQVKERLGAQPERVLCDTTYVTQDEIIAFAEQGTDVYSPVPPDKANVRPETIRRREKEREREPAALKAWRNRMTDAASALTYRRRLSIETVNGTVKARGLAILRVRSKAKARCVVLFQALAHNLWRAHGLRTAQACAA